MKTRKKHLYLRMKKFIFTLFAVLGLLISCSQTHKSPYDRLDNAIELQEYYDLMFTRQTDSIAILYQQAETDSAKWEQAYMLETMFFYHVRDSCKRYIEAMLQLCGNDIRQKKISTCNLIYFLYRTDSLQKARIIYESLDTTGMDAECLNIYYDAGYHIYRDFSITQPEFEKQKQKILDLWWLHDSTNIRCTYYNNENLRKNGRSKEAIERLRRCPTATLNDTAILHDYIAREQYYIGDTGNAIENLAIAAECDMRLAAKTYHALYLLYEILLQEGDIDRASRYLRVTRKDAFAANMRSRYEETMVTEMEIMDLLLEQYKQKHTAYFTTTIVTTILLAVAIILLGLLKRSSNRLLISKDKLSEVSKIKDKFLAIYMEKCVEFLNKVDNYRSSLRSAMKHEGIEAVTAMLRQPSFADGEFKELLADFDSAFLGIFPDFADKVNKHMKEGHHLTMPSEGELSTELRILALIRMGICKRQKIAKVLNMSVTTVYSYHSNLKKHSIHSDASFDKIIANL